MLLALELSLGVVTTASKKANITGKTHYGWIKNDSEYAEKVREIKEQALDFAESKLFQLMKGVVLPDTKVFVNHDDDGKAQITRVPVDKHLAPDKTSLIFYLKTQGKHRGYVERTEVVAQKIKVTRTVKTD